MKSHRIKLHVDVDDTIDNPLEYALYLKDYLKKLKGVDDVQLAHVCDMGWEKSYKVEINELFK